jgi:hypothetical protein
VTVVLLVLADLLLILLVGLLVLDGGRPGRRPEPRHPRSADPDTWPMPLPPATAVSSPLPIGDEDRARYMDAIRAHDAAQEPLPDGVRDAIERHVRRASVVR